MHYASATTVVFTNNETNVERLYGMSNANPYVKDGINNFIVHGRREAVNPDRSGTKAAVAYRLALAPGVSRTVRLRLNEDAAGKDFLGSAFEKIFAERQREANEFYGEDHSTCRRRGKIANDAAGIRRDALEQAGLYL